MCSALLRRLCLALMIVAFPLTASAQETFKLTIIDGYPTKALWVKILIDYYIPEVDKRLAADGNKYKIEWQQAFGGQIAKPRGVMDAIKNRLGDMGVVTTVFHSSKLPLNNLPYYTPFSSRDPILVSKVIDELTDKFPAFQKQFDDQNQILLTSYSSIDTYGIFTKNPVAKMEDLKGLKINAAGPNALYTQSLGAVAVQGSLLTYANQIKTGVTDGCNIWPEATITFKIAEVAPNYLETDFGTGVNKSLTINTEVWKGLPAPVQKVLKETARDYRDKVAQAALDKAAASIKKFKAMGGKIVKLSEADKKKWADSMPNIAQDLAKDVEEKQGYPAMKILAAYMDALRAGGAKPARDWDKN
ncbi:MAG: C4-dicarboxylate TRAP transporter substrate-binding protein [Pseudolabrys sp.]|nr:C4-dicarboxylate TRAP transporter substrate-binding protein [Pseudolabrys sp.]